MVHDGVNGARDLLPEANLQEIGGDRDELRFRETLLPFGPLALVLRQSIACARTVADDLGHLGDFLVGRPTLDHGEHLVGGQPHHQRIRIHVAPVADQVGRPATTPFARAADGRVPEKPGLGSAAPQTPARVAHETVIAIAAAPEPAIEGKDLVVVGDDAVAREVRDRLVAHARLRLDEGRDVLPGNRPKGGPRLRAVGDVIAVTELGVREQEIEGREHAHVVGDRAPDIVGELLQSRQ